MYFILLYSKRHMSYVHTYVDKYVFCIQYFSVLYCICKVQICIWICAGVVPQEGSMNAKLIGYKTLQDENTELTPLVEPPSPLTEGGDHQFVKAQSISLGGVQHAGQEGLKEHQRHLETYMSLDSATVKSINPTLQHWGDVSSYSTAR